MSLFDYFSLDFGSHNGGPYGGAARAAANFVATASGTQRECAGAIENPIEYEVQIPSLQIDGTTATSGTVTPSIIWYASDKTTVVSTTTYPAQAIGTVKTYRLARPFNGYWFTPTLTLSGGGNAGDLHAGVVRGGHSINRAF